MYEYKYSRTPNLSERSEIVDFCLNRPILLLTTFPGNVNMAVSDTRQNEVTKTVRVTIRFDIIMIYSVAINFQSSAVNYLSSTQQFTVTHSHCQWLNDIQIVDRFDFLNTCPIFAEYFINLSRGEIFSETIYFHFWSFGFQSCGNCSHRVMNVGLLVSSSAKIGCVMFTRATVLASLRKRVPGSA